MLICPLQIWWISRLRWVASCRVVGPDIFMGTNLPCWQSYHWIQLRWPSDLDSLHCHCHEEWLVELAHFRSRSAQVKQRSVTVLAGQRGCKRGVPTDNFDHPACLKLSQPNTLAHCHTDCWSHLLFIYTMPAMENMCSYMYFTADLRLLWLYPQCGWTTAP
jgi:hypothetical protein